MESLFQRNNKIIYNWIAITQQYNEETI